MNRDHRFWCHQHCVLNHHKSLHISSLSRWFSHNSHHKKHRCIFKLWDIMCDMLKFSCSISVLFHCFRISTCQKTKQKAIKVQYLKFYISNSGCVFFIHLMLIWNILEKKKCHRVSYSFVMDQFVFWNYTESLKWCQLLILYLDGGQITILKSFVFFLSS